MGFKHDGFARLWSVENKGNYSVANISTSKKNKDTSNYETDFQNKFVRLVGEAHEFAKRVNIPAKGGLPVKITSCEVTNKYDENKKTTYWNCVVYGLEDASFNNNSGGNKSSNNYTAKPKSAAPQYAPADNDDVQLPF